MREFHLRGGRVGGGQRAQGLLPGLVRLPACEFFRPALTLEPALDPDLLQAAADGLTAEYKSPMLDQLLPWAVRQAELELEGKYDPKTHDDEVLADFRALTTAG